MYHQYGHSGIQFLPQYGHSGIQSILIMVIVETNVSPICSQWKLMYQQYGHSGN